MIAESDSEDESGGHQPAARASRAAPLRRSPAEEQPDQQRHEERVQGVHVGTHGDGPGLLSEGEDGTPNGGGGCAQPRVAFVDEVTGDQYHQARGGRDADR